MSNPAERPGRADRRRGARLICGALTEHPGALWWGIATGLGWTLTKLASPLLVTTAIDDGIVGGDGDRLALAVWAIACLGAAGAVLAGLRRYFGQSLAYRVETDLRGRIFAHVHRLHLGFHDRAPAGEILARAATDLQQISQPIIGIPMLVSNVLMLAGGAAMLVLIDPGLASVGLASVVLVVVSTRSMSSRLGPRTQLLQRRLADLSATVEESVSGIRAIKGLGIEGAERVRLHARTDDVYDAARSMIGVRAAFLPLVDLLPALGLAGVLYVGGHGVAAGELTIGQLVQANYAVLMLVGPLRIMGMTVAGFQRAFVSAALVEHLLSTVPDVASNTVQDDAGTDDAAHAGGARSGPRAGARVTFERVRFGYDPARAVLDGLDLELAVGETVAVVGVTGSGKTTLASLLPRLYDVTGGRVLLDGRDVRDLPLDAVRSAVGFVFEETHLFSGTIGSNIAFGRPGAAPEQIERAARQAGAHEFVAALPRGYDSEVGERGLGLSGGQRQRIALARALVTDPRVLILDAPTSAVDAATEEGMRASLRPALQGRTTLLVAHRPATLDLADRIVLLHEGRIVDSGSREALTARSPLFRAIVDGQEPLAEEAS